MAIPDNPSVGRVLFAILFFLSTSLWAQAQTSELKSDPLFEAVSGLLKRAPRLTDRPISETQSYQERADQLYKKLGKSETVWSLPGANIPMFDAEREQVLAELKTYPDYLHRLGIFLPRRPEVLEWAAQQFKSEDHMPDWLVANSPNLRAKLVDRASKGHEICLRALVILDWERAEPMVRKLLTGKDYLRALAALRYHPGAEDESREALLRTYSDRTSGKFERSYAAGLLLSYDWEGRDEFFEDVLQNPCWLQDDTDPISDFVAAHPEWLPRLVKMLGESGSIEHNNAVLGILALVEGSPEPENLRPLLPWLNDDAWTKVMPYKRLYVVEALGQVDLPEAVPGLLKILTSDASPGELFPAARALELYQYENLEVVWRKTKPRFHDSGHIAGSNTGLIDIGVRNGWVTLDEQVEAVRLLVSEVGRPPDWDGDVEGKYPFKRVLASACIYGQPSEAFVERLASLAESWHHERRWELEKLEEVLFKYPNPAVTNYLIRRVEQGDVSTDLLEELLYRRSVLKEEHRRRLLSSLEAGGANAGLARVMLGRLEIDRRILQNDHAQALGILAVARFLGEPLPTEWLRVAATAPNLRSAVLSYVEVSEREVSRKLLKELSGGYAITGRKSDLVRLDKIEKTLVRRYQAEGHAGDLYVLLTSRDGHSLVRGNTELRIKDGLGELTFNTQIRDPYEQTIEHPCYDRRSLDRKEVESFQKFLKEEAADTWGQWLNITSHHFTSYQFLHLAPDGGHRLSMIFNDGTDQGVGKKYAKLIEMFERMKAKPAQTVYEFMNDIPEARIIDDRDAADMLWADEEGLKVRLLDDKFESYWRLLGLEGVEGPVKAQPPFPSDRYHDGGRFVTLPDQTRLIVRLERLTKAKKGGREKLFLTGRFTSPVVEPSGRRVLLAQTEGRHFGEPNILSLADLIEATQHKVHLPKARSLRPVAFLKTHKKFLVVRSDSEKFQASTAEWYLVDPWTGDVSPVEGEFRPWLEMDERGLQQADGSRYWATMKTGLGTEVGLIDEQTFRFEVKAHYPGLHFGPSQMWVQDNLVYVTIGDIVKLPLTKPSVPL